MTPNEFTTQWASVFLQDTIELVDERWFLTLGTRLEQHTFGEFQVEPTAAVIVPA